MDYLRGERWPGSDGLEDLKHFLRFVLLAWIPLNSSTQVKQIDSQNNTITKFPYFYPPDGWEMIDPNLLSPKVLVGFVKKTKQGFLPSMNLAIEDVDISLSQYIKEVKKLYEVTDSVWRDLGSFITSEGNNIDGIVV